MNQVRAACALLEADASPRAKAEALLSMGFKQTSRRYGIVSNVEPGWEEALDRFANGQPHCLTADWYRRVLSRAKIEDVDPQVMAELRALGGVAH